MNAIHPNIEKLKKELALAETRLKQHSKLMINRERLAEEIEKLKEELYQLARHTKQSAAQNQAIDEKKELLKDSREKLKQIDHLLDESEDVSLLTIEQKKAGLIHQILLNHPEHKEEQEKRMAQLQMALQQEKHLYQIQEVFTKIKEILDIVIYTRQTIKGRGLLNYIFGTSPNLIIEKHLLEGRRIAEAGSTFLSHIQHPFAVASFTQDLNTFLNKLVQQFKQPWGFSHIDTLFTQAKEQATSYVERINSGLKDTQRQIDDLKQEIENWLEQF